ncbi:MAG: energy transducer TonB [Bacteroidales bacterium]|nr:energy transducer TonB [Bacteroidales bacterium]
MNIHQFFENNLNGILGTIVFHMALFVLFLGLKVHTLKEEVSPELVIEFAEMPTPEQPQQSESDKGDEPVNLTEQEIKNIAVNQAQLSEELSTEKFVEQFKQEMSIQDHQAPDDWRQESPIMEQPAQHFEKPRKETYHGPTSVTYFLENRTKTRLPLPVYKCQGNGTITVSIAVTQNGKVKDARVTKVESSDADCLSDAALTAAFKSFFNADANAPATQKGTITYTFYKQ